MEIVISVAFLAITSFLLSLSNTVSELSLSHELLFPWSSWNTSSTDALLNTSVLVAMAISCPSM